MLETIMQIQAGSKQTEEEEKEEKNHYMHKYK